MVQDCPPGYILRKGYTRKFSKNVKSNGYTVRRKGTIYTVRPKAHEISVAASCIKDRGLPGKGPNSIGKLRKGELIKYGYQYRLSDANRRKALQKAIKQYGVLSVYRKLDAVAKLSVRTAPDASKIFSKDRNWIHDNFKK
jgi:hypothetical protein